MAENHEDEIKRREKNNGVQTPTLLLNRVAGSGDLEIVFKEHSSQATILPAGTF